jgi:hypothetical protein
MFPGLILLIQLVTLIYISLLIYSLVYTYENNLLFYSILIGGLIIPLMLYYYYTYPIIKLARQKSKKLPLLSKIAFTRMILLTIIPFQISSALELSLHV